MSRVEIKGKFVANNAPIGSDEWAVNFRRRYGEEAYLEVRNFINEKAREEDFLDKALGVALHSAAECYPDDRIYPDDTWTYTGPDY